MTSWHLGAMCAFDLESTGVDVEADRIVTACVATLDGSGKSAPEVRNWLAWPGIEIPEAATKVHGITTAEAHEHGLPAEQVTGEVCDALLEAAAAGVPVIAFNAAYDLTLLDREAVRYQVASLTWDLEAADVLVIDPLVLDKALDRYRKGSRKLGDTAAHYGVRAEGAHSADGDAVAAARVAWKIAVKYPHIGRMGASQLMVFQKAAAAEQARSFADYLRRQGKGAEADAVSGAWPWRPLAAGAAA